MSEYLHGLEINLKTTSSPAMKPIRTAVIGVVGTAQKGDFNKPYLLDSFKKAKEYFVIDKVASLEDVENKTGDLAVSEEQKKKVKSKSLPKVSKPEDYTLIRALEAIYEHGNALVVAVRSKSGKNADVTAAIEALQTAKAAINYKPKLLIAPTFSHETDVRNKLLGVANLLRAEALISDKKNAAVDQSIVQGKDFSSSSRYFFSHDWVEGVGNIGEMCLTPFIAGLIAKTDAEHGFWSSPSNREFMGIRRILSPRVWSMGDKTCEVNRLNEHGVASIIREGGFRLWGARTLGKNDPLEDAHKFLNVRRITDSISDTIDNSMLWAVDKNISKAYVEQVQESIDNYLRTLRQGGAIINGKAWASEDNTPESIENGIVKFRFDYTPTYPAERVQIEQIITNKYVGEIFK